MVTTIQVPVGEVLEATDSQFRWAIWLVGSAIEEAWATTRRQIEGASFDPRISQTAFAQFLVHNVRNEIFRLGSTSAEVETILIPNRKRSSHHIVVRFGNYWITVSAVKGRSDRPRPATFRTDYTYRQMTFVVDESTNLLEVVPPSDVRQKRYTYIQMLHGPSPENRQIHGFTLLAFTTPFGKYEPHPIDVSKFLNPENPKPGAAEEPVPEDLGIELK